MQPINRRLSKLLTPFLASWGLTPNKVTLLGLAAGLFCAWNFLRGTASGWMLGALWFQLAYVLDNCDGDLARMTGRSSGFGSWLDVVTDCIIHMAFFLSLGVGLHRFGAGSFWLWLGIATAGAVFFTYVAYLFQQVSHRGQEAWIHPDPPGGQDTSTWWGKFRKFSREDFSLIVLVSAVLHQMGWLLISGLMGALVIVVVTMISALERIRA